MAKFRLGEIYLAQNNIEQAIALYKEAANAGYAPAQYDLAVRYDSVTV